MESGQVREQLRAMDSAAASPYVDYPSTPWWFLPGAGLWAAALVHTGFLTSLDPAIGLPVIAVLMVALGAFVTWYRQRRARPRPGVRRAMLDNHIAWWS